jgi:hypothetical protein
MAGVRNKLTPVFSYLGLEAALSANASPLPCLLLFYVYRPKRAAVFGDSVRLKRAVHE